MRRLFFIFSIVFTVLFLASLSTAVRAEAPAMAKVLPSGFHNGWALEAKAELYNQDNLFEHINGEAELYMPYRFDLLATASYINKKSPDVLLVADVYRMGSLLDAFGVYSNYRKADYEPVKTGAEGFISLTQMMFYQGRYFVRLQATGTTGGARDIFLDSAKVIAATLPADSSRPGELDILSLPGIAPKTERYLAQSLLGYAFFRKGLIADAPVSGDQMRIFILFEDNRESARKAFNAYYAYLKEEGQDAAELLQSGTPERVVLAATDSLYGSVLLEQSDRYVIGAIRVNDRKAAGNLIEKLRNKVSGSAIGKKNP
jgi:hypothetical protein